MEIINAAKKLFTTHGYSHTPVKAIIKEAGIAKGTFYYYFKSKNDLLGALVEQIGLEMESYYKAIIQIKELSALDKLKLMLKGPEKKAISDNPIMEILHKPENREFQEQLNIQAVKIIAPLIAEVIEQGNKEGLFNAAFPEDAVQILLAGSQFILDSGLFNWTAEKKGALLETLQTLFEMAIGAKPGSLDFITEYQE